MGIMEWLSGKSHDKDSKGTQAPDKQASQEPNESSIESYLRTGKATPGFALLAEDVKEKLIAKVMGMPRAVQAEVLTRMQSMPLDELISFATSERAPPKTEQKRNYTVTQGDSLSKIAKAHQISVKDLVAANPQIDNPDLIYPEQVINLPTVSGE